MTGLSWQALRTRLVAGALCASVASIWIVTLVIGKYLRADMEAAISAQQYSTVSLIASEIERSVSERSAILGKLARRLGDAGDVDGRAAQALLESQSGLEPMFNWGVIVLDADGLAISSVPDKHNRVGGRYGDLAFFDHHATSPANRVSPTAQASSRCCIWRTTRKASLVGSTDCISHPVVPIFTEDDSSSTPRELTATPEPS